MAEDMGLENNFQDNYGLLKALKMAGFQCSMRLMNTEINPLKLQMI